MNYIKIIDKWAEKERLEPVNSTNFLSYLIDLLNLLSRHKMTRDELTPDIASCILEKLKIDDLLPHLQLKYQKFLISYLDYFSQLLLQQVNIEEQPKEKPVIEEGCEIDESLILRIDPDELPDKKIDVEFMKKLGVEIE